MLVNFKLGGETRNDVINMSRKLDWKFLAQNLAHNE